MFGDKKLFKLWQVFGFVSFSFFSLIIVIYFVYYIYISKFTKKKSRANLFFPENKDDFSTAISVVIPTYNEEKIIKQKLVNISEQTYPKRLMEIIVIDSNSKDDTVNIIKDFVSLHPELNINIITENERKGKSQAINKAFSSASPQIDILFMTDVDALLEKDAIEKVVLCFNNKQIGAVCGTEVILNVAESGETISEATYRQYYKKLRLGESVLDSTPIFDGELSAYKSDIIRGKNVKENLNADDSQLAIIVRRKGYRSICCPDAIFYEYAPSDWSSMKLQKIRRGQGLSRMFWYNKDIIFNKNFGRFGSIIFPVNFFMHVISPFLFFSALLFGSVFIYGYTTKNFIYFFFLISSIPIILYLKSFLLRINLLRTGWTFFLYQMILLEGMLYYIFGRSLYKWQKVESIRSKF